MPNMKNAIKKVKQTKKVTEANRHVNSTVKNAIKSLDNAKVKGLVHENKVNREKSRLTKKVNNMEVK